MRSSLPLSVARNVSLDGRPIHVCGLGGSTRPDSSTERLMAAVLSRLQAAGAHTELHVGKSLDLPIYTPGIALTAEAAKLLDSVRNADALLIGSPGYHGSISGLVKNALDYFEELRDDRRPYLSSRPVGLVVTAYGWQAAVTTLGALREITHALRGWPTPLGIAVNVAVNKGMSAIVEDHDLGRRIDAMAGELDFMARACRTANPRVPVG